MKKPEDFLIITLNDDFFSIFKSEFKKHGYPSDNFKCPESKNSYETLRDKIFSNNFSVILVDSSYSKGDDELVQTLSSKKLAELKKTIQAGKEVPYSLVILRMLDIIKNKENRTDLLIFYLINNPSSYLTQEILRIGANWVWPYRGKPSKLLEVVISLRRLRTKNQHVVTKRGRILVVENSLNTCHLIRNKLDKYFDVVFVGENKAEYELNIHPEQAIERYKQELKENSVFAVVIDLALTDISEKEARIWFLDNDRALEAIGIMESKDLFSIFGGLHVVREIRKLSPDVQLFILSNYTHITTVKGLINEILGPAVMKTVDYLSKSEDGYKELLSQLLVKHKKT